MSVCTGVTDKVIVFNKLGFKFHLDIPAKMIIENVIFDFTESFIPYQDDTYNVLTTRQNICSFDEATETLKLIVPTSLETCKTRIYISDFCHKNSKYNMMTFHPYNSTYGLASPPELYLIGVTFKRVFYDVNSLVDFSLGGFVFIQNSEFYQFST